MDGPIKENEDIRDRELNGQEAECPTYCIRDCVKIIKTVFGMCTVYLDLANSDDQYDNLEAKCWF